MTKTKSPREEDIKRWNSRFRELERYKAEHGHCNVNSRDGPLGCWVSRQRKVFQQWKKLRRSRLVSERTERLNSIGFCWTPRIEVKSRPPREEDVKRWNARFNELERYQAEHGHCDVSARSGSLGQWVHGQRKQFRQSKLPYERVERLNSIGFCWAYQSYNADSLTQDQIKLWNTRFSELKRYKAEHGDCNVVVRKGQSTTDRSLAKWVEFQRKELEVGTMSRGRMKRLESIGFDERNLDTRRERSDVLAQHCASRISSRKVGSPHRDSVTEAVDEDEEIGALIYEAVVRGREKSGESFIKKVPSTRGVASSLSARSRSNRTIRPRKRLVEE